MSSLLTANWMKSRGVDADKMVVAYDQAQSAASAKKPVTGTAAKMQGPLGYFKSIASHYKLTVSRNSITIPVGTYPTAIGFEVVGTKQAPAAKGEEWMKVNAAQKPTKIILTNGVYEDGFGIRYRIRPQTERVITEIFGDRNPQAYYASGSKDDFFCTPLKAPAKKHPKRIDDSAFTYKTYPKCKKSILEKIWNAVVSAFKAIGNCCKAVAKYLFCRSAKKPALVGPALVEEVGKRPNPKDAPAQELGYTIKGGLLVLN